jgi:hypothetical protein
MNIYVATNKHRVGMVICNNENSIYYYGSFETQSLDKACQLTSASQRAVSYLKANNVEADNTINIYSDTLVEFPNIPEYLRKHNFTLTSNVATTDKEKQRLLLARVETEMAERRKAIGIKER